MKFSVIAFLMIVTIIEVKSAAINNDCPRGVWNGTDVLLPVENCNQFIHCDNFGVGHLKNCAPSDPPLVFDEKKQQCVWPHESDREECNSNGGGGGGEPTPEPHPQCPTGEWNGTDVLLAVENCNQFIHCDNFGVGHLKNCAPSDPPLVFDEKKQQCVWPHESDREECRSSTKPTEPSSCATSTQAPSTTSKPPIGSCSEYTTTEPYPGCPSGPVTPGESPVHLEITKDCNRFVHCDNYGIGHIKCCAPSAPLYPDLVFDINFDKCVWPWESNRTDC